MPGLASVMAGAILMWLVGVQSGNALASCGDYLHTRAGAALSLPSRAPDVVSAVLTAQQAAGRADHALTLQSVQLQSVQLHAVSVVPDMDWLGALPMPAPVSPVRPLRRSCHGPNCHQSPLPTQLPLMPSAETADERAAVLRAALIALRPVPVGVVAAAGTASVCRGYPLQLDRPPEWLLTVSR